MTASRPAMEMDARLQIQDFETDLLGVPVGRLLIPEDRDPEDLATAIGRLVADWTDNGVWLVSCRVPDASSLVPALKANGFEAVETLVTFRRALADAPATAGVERAGPEDADACVAIARGAFVHDRLHRDARVPNAVADKVRAAWIRNDLGGRADASFVVRVGGAVAGFNLCLLDGDEAVIDLIAVDPGRQGQGLGRALVQGALAHYGGRAAAMRVGTQADNEPSIRLYRGAGFVEADRRITLHWVNQNAAPK